MRVRVLGFLAAFLTLVTGALGVVALNQHDTFQDTTTMSWSGGSSPTNVANGGPQGTGDRYLQISSTGGKLATFNIDRWSGNFPTAGVARMEADLRNFGATDLTIRLVLFGVNGDRWSSNTSFVLPSGSTWTHAGYDLQAANFTQTVGSGTFADTLSNVDRIMFRHETVISSGGSFVAGILGIDNVAGITGGPNRPLLINSMDPASGVPITVWHADAAGQKNGVTAFIRNYATGFSAAVTAPGAAMGGTRAFSHWEKDGVRVATSKTLGVVMNGLHSITAVYGPSRTITVTSSGPATLITVWTADLNGAKNGTTTFSRIYADGATVSMTAPASSGGLFFQKWTRNGVQVGSAKTITFLANGDHTMSAVYVAAQTLTVTSTGVTGVAMVVYQKDLNGLQNGTTDFTRTYGTGSSVGLTAPATSGGKTFHHWNLDGAQQGTAKTITVTMGAPHTLTAVYQ